jgi:hypothetical protein
METHTQTLTFCKNCGNEFEENFCNRCGQKEVHRITLHYVLHNMMHVFLHADKGIFPFMVKLIYQPGYIAREFIDGKRKIFNPFQYLLFSVAIIVFLLSKSGFYESLQNSNLERASALSSTFQTAMVDFTWFVKKYANIISFAALPVYAFFAWLFFKKRNENYAEHVTVLVFTLSQVNTLNAILLTFLIFANVTGHTSALFTSILLTACFAITYKQFFQLNWLKAIWKSILIYATAYMVQVFIMGLGLLIYIIILSRK